MATFKPAAGEHKTVVIDGESFHLLSSGAYKGFDTSILGLGDITHSSYATDAIAAVFDLEGFTKFCGQIEPQLSVPLFLSQFLDWLMDSLKREMRRSESKQGVILWSPLPFYLKFMGDGLLVLWDASGMSEDARRSVVVVASEICDRYKDTFLPKMGDRVVEPPPRLRCGLARGTVYSVGDGNDYVGSCINMAARLQKLPGLTFAFNRRGFVLDEPESEFFTDELIVKRVAIRGIGENELVAILKSEFKSLAPEDKAFYRSTAMPATA